MKLSLCTVTVVLSLTLGVAAVPVWAQQRPTRPERPYRGLFGGGSGKTEQSLTLTLSFGGGYDDDIQVETQDPGEVFLGDPQTAESGSYSYLVGNLSYSLNRDRFDFGAGFAGDARYYPGLSEGVIATYSGSLGETVQFTERTQLGANQSVTYQPFYTFAPFPALFDPGVGQVTVPEQDFRVTSADSVAYEISVDVSHGLSRRASLAASYSYSLTDFASSDLDIAFHSAQGRFSYALTKSLGARLGYGYGQSGHLHERDADRVRTHSLDAGLDFNRALSLTRRLKLAFNAGVTAIVIDEQTHYDVIGGARLDREIGRSWNASLAYSRSVGFVAPFEKPLLYDSATFDLAGLITQRLQLHSGAGAVIGNVGVADEGNGFTSYYATAGLGFPLTRQLALGADYTFYRYSFDSVVLPGIRVGHTYRQSVRAYITFWLPLLQRARRPDAPR